MAAPGAGVLVSAVLALSVCVIASGGELPRISHHPKDDEILSLLVLGDWGRRGLYNQSEVADQMGRIGDRLGIDFVVSTGDNFYEDGLVGVDDPAFFDSFSNLYTAPSLQTPWYTGLAEFFFVDTTPMVVQYWENPEDHHYDWRGVAPRETYIRELLEVEEEEEKGKDGV